MVSNEELASLYLSTVSVKNRDIIFKKLWNNLSKGAMKVCHYYSNALINLNNTDFFEELEQEAKICLFKTIERFKIDRNVKFSTFYYTCLKNYLSDIFDKKFNTVTNEIVDTSLIGWQKGFSRANFDKVADNKTLYNILNDYIEKIKFSKPAHENIFRDYYGFNKEMISDNNFANLSRKYGITRVAIKKVCDKYFLELKKLLKNNGDIDRIRLFL